MWRRERQGREVWGEERGTGRGGKWRKGERYGERREVGEGSRGREG